jgi:hypothetical protein
MKLIPYIFAVLLLSSCDSQKELSVPTKSESESKTSEKKLIELPREKALHIAGEIVAAQRLNRSLPGMSGNEPDLTVVQVYAVPTRPKLALAVCRYWETGDGCTLLVRHDVSPLAELAMIGGQYYSDVKTVKIEPLKNGEGMLEVSSLTRRGNDAGTEKLIVRQDDTLKWVQRSPP